MHVTTPTQASTTTAFLHIILGFGVTIIVAKHHCGKHLKGTTPSGASASRSSGLVPCVQGQRAACRLQQRARLVLHSTGHLRARWRLLLRRTIVMSGWLHAGRAAVRLRVGKAKRHSSGWSRATDRPTLRPSDSALAVKVAQIPTLTACACPGVTHALHGDESVNPPHE